RTEIQLLRDFCAVIVIAFFFFFFQAEDGIRDATVTGVQTCALPICPSRRPIRSSACSKASPLPNRNQGSSSNPRSTHSMANAIRSEERRVGKECRSRMERYHVKKKKKRR